MLRLDKIKKTHTQTGKHTHTETLLCVHHTSSASSEFEDAIAARREDTSHTSSSAAQTRQGMQNPGSLFDVPLTPIIRMF